MSLNACKCRIWSALWKVRVWLCRFWFSIMLLVSKPTIPMKSSVRGIDQLGSPHLLACGFPSQRASNAESISMSWCHHAIVWCRKTEEKPFMELPVIWWIVTKFERKVFIIGINYSLSQIIFVFAMILFEMKVNEMWFKVCIPWFLNMLMILNGIKMSLMCNSRMERFAMTKTKRSLIWSCFLNWQHISHQADLDAAYFFI